MAQTLGKIIKRHRIWQDLNCKEMAGLSGISYSYYLKIEQGEYDPSIKTLSKIAKALKTPLWQIIKEAEEEINNA